MARLAHAVTLDNPRIHADVVEVEEFPTLARMYSVRGVPKTVINQVIQFVGAVPEEHFVAKVLQAGGRDDLVAQEQPAPQTGGQSTALG